MTKKEFKKFKKKNINQYRTAQKKLFWFVCKNLGYKRDGLKLNKAIDITIEYLGIENINNKSEWLLLEYLKQDLDILKRVDVGFYLSKEWKNLRKIILKKYGCKCMKCGSIENIAVDHILPRSKFPELELSENNMQVLCLICNSSKGNKHYTDYR